MADSVSLLKAKIAKEKRDHFPVLGVSDQVSRSRVLNEGYDLNEGSFVAGKSKGKFIYDLMERPYLDFALGAGSMILGHGDQAVLDAVRKQLGHGTLFVRPNIICHEYAELLNEVQGGGKCFAFCNSGAEATMRAMRAARGFTSRPIIALATGAWHGSSDWGLFQEDYDSDPDRPELSPKSAGIPRDLGAHLVLLPPQREEAAAYVRAHRDRIAMIFVEPVQGPLPRQDIGDYLSFIHDLARDNAILLGFDEVVTGFRVGLGGAQQKYAVDADIITYGKIAGGGLPMGIVGIREGVARQISANNPEAERVVFFGGTFSANPLSVTAGYQTVKQLQSGAARIYPAMGDLIDGFALRMNRVLVDENIPVRILAAPGLFRFVFTDAELLTRRQRDALELDRSVQEMFYDLLLLAGIHFGSNRINFLSSLHSSEDMDRLFECVCDALRLMKEAKCFGR